MRGDDAHLLDMLLAARDAEEFATQLTFPQFERDRLRQNAIIRAIEIVGEAAGRISPETQRAHPEVPWRQVIGMRHRLVHGYFDVSLPRVWDTVRKDIPHLIAVLERMLPPEAK